MNTQFNSCVSDLAASTELLWRNEEKEYSVFRDIIGPLTTTWESGKIIKKARAEADCILRHVPVNGFTHRITLCPKEARNSGRSSYRPLLRSTLEYENNCDCGVGVFIKPEAFGFIRM
jgi:hypothetical protein